MRAWTWVREDVEVRFRAQRVWLLLIAAGLFFTTVAKLGELIFL